MFFFNDTAATEIYTLSLHDALPIFPQLVPRGEGDLDAAGGEVGQVVLVDLVEQRDRPQLRRGDHVVARYWCTRWIAMAPSPTAEATRFIESSRTSPAANTPGVLVSRA